MMVGQTIYHYKIIEKLGEGGMGVVYKAHDTKLDRIVALKFLPTAGGEKEKARLIREAQAIAQLDHPNICTVHEIGDSEGVPYIAMAYIEGETLRDRVGNGPLVMNEIIDYTRQIARGLQSAHRKHITHRDIKSANIMITPDGQIKIMDFGLAKLAGRTQLTQEGSTAGTVMYMSPEQARGEDVDHRTDIWSFGVVLYEMLTGRLPFQSEYETAAVYSILNEDPPPIGNFNPDVPPELEAIVMRTLQKNKEDRYQQLDELLSDLDVFTGTAVGGTDWRRVFAGRKPFLYAAAVFFLLLVVAAVFFLGSPVPEARAIESIAVLPFTNLSNDPDQEYFSDGMMEEILDRLFKIGDLKVISRTSSMRYKNTDKSIKEIARELGVANILEGSVRRSGNNVRITVQLINAKTDAHLWSEIYDGDLSDLSRIFFIQSEVAQSVARELKAVIAPQEIALIEKAPTKNMEAYNYFLKGNEYFFRSYDEQDYSIAISMYSKAIELDPQFAQAYIRLSISHASMYWFHYDRSAERIIKSKEAIDAATRIDPEIPEIHLALGYYYYWCFLDYPKALEELELSETKLPNNWECINTKSAVHRRAGEWKLAKEYVLLALTMDQSNPDITFQTAEILFLLGEYEEAERFFIKTTFLNPTLIYNYWARSLMYLKWNGNTFKARETINEAMKFKEATNNPQIVETMALMDLFDGNYQMAITFLLSKDLEIIENQFYFRPKSLHIANIYRIMGNMDLARQNFDNARIELETRINHDPNDSRLFSALGIVYAGLGMKEEAIESGKKGVDLMPIEKEAFRGVYRVEDLARIYVMTGEYQEAIKLLDRLLSLPGPLSVKLLLLDPTWKPLWNLTEFKKITNKYIRNDKHH